MSSSGWLTAPGELLDSSTGLRTTKAAALARLLGDGAVPYFRLVECRRAPAGDVIVFDVRPEVPQFAAVPIRRTERMGVIFYDADDLPPSVMSMRSDFPALPHVLVPEDHRPWPFVCLYDASYDELRGRWTARRFARRVHQWLSEVARGELYHEDERMEPFIAVRARQVVVPDRLFTHPNPPDAPLYASAKDDGELIYFLSYDPPNADQPIELEVCALTVSSQQQGPLRREPQTVAVLHELLAPLGVDVRAELRQRVRDLQSEGAGSRHLMIVVTVPLHRAEGLEPERIDVLLFLTIQTISDLGVALGVLARQGEEYGHLLTGAELPADSATIELCRPVRTLTREFAAALNGVAADARRVVAVGVGALGSQVVGNLAHAGFGEWVLIDHDTFLPHNTVRHALPSAAVGWNKANALALMLNGYFDGEPLASAVRENIIRRGDACVSALSAADLIIDAAASVPAARAISIDYEGSGRRASIFLNLTGTDLVLLLEDQDRRTRLDDLEMQYYRAVLNEPRLRDHLAVEGTRLRYGQSCRDVSSDLSQALVGMHAGIAARALRSGVDAPEARMQIWSSSPDCDVSLHAPRIAAPHVYVAGRWQIRTDEHVVARLRRFREAKLPNETGGVLLGHHDLERKILYVVDVLAAPPDSKEWPVAYIRGAEGLRDVLDEVAARTANMITYVGEWHSHPRGTPAVPSEDDLNVALWITEEMDKEELPGLLGIVGDDGPRWYVADVLTRDPLAIRLIGAAPA